MKSEDKQSDKSMNKGLIVLTLLLCVAAFSVALAESVSAQTAVTPGVKAGDVFKYTSSSYWTSSNAYDSIPTDLQAVNQTVSFEVRISEVNDTFVTTFSASYHPDGTADAGRGTVNIQTGAITDSGFPAIIGANLSPGQIIHPYGNDGIYVNSSSSIDNRPTAVIIISLYNATTGVTSSNERNFDQATGVLVQEVESSSDGGAISGYTSLSRVTTTLRSSPWNEQTVPTPEFPPVLALPIFIGATTLILIALKKKHMIAGYPAVKA
jgi:hypothetical protein